MTLTQTRPIVADIETRAAADGTTLSFVATTAGMKRDGLDILISGISTENFMRNPVFLWAHDYFGERLPIGKVTSIRPLKSKMKVRVEFDTEDEFAMQVKSKFDRGFLNTVSIGWETLEFDRDTNTVLKSDLLDVSAVPVPGDPDALIERQRSLMRSLGTELLERFAEADFSDDDEESPAVSDPRDRIEQPPGTDYATTASTGLHTGGLILGKISGEQPDQRSGDAAEQHHPTEEVDQMERLERLMSALDEFRSALADVLESDVDESDDESFAALLRAFGPVAGSDDNEKGEED